jgi:hypothetical protein
LTSGRVRSSLQIVLASIAGVSACLVPASALAHNVNPRITGTAVVGGEQVEIATHGDPVPPAPATPAVSPHFAGIPTSWCGSPRATDDIANETGSLDDAKIHLVYAYPADQPNRFSTYADMIQGDVGAIADKVAAQEGSAKSLRFDLGTSGGVDCVDITTVPLPNPASYYNATPGTAFAKLRADVSPTFGFGTPGIDVPEHPRNLLIYADRITPTGIGGQATLILSDTPSGTAHDQGGLMAASFYSASRWDGSPTAAQIATRRDISLHEAAHNLGAVQGNDFSATGGPVQDPAPHGSREFHCYDEWDVMCYSDGGPYFDDGGTLDYDCGTFEEPVPQLFDCGQDDYFRTPDPPAGSDGSYLAAHWNLYDSGFLCAVSPATACVPTNLAVPPSGGSAAGTSPASTAAPRTKKKCAKKKRAASAKRKRCKRKR